MGFVVLAGALGLVASLVTGGRLRALGEVRLLLPGLLVAALGLQVAAAFVPEPWHMYVVLVSLGTVAGVVCGNARQPGWPLLGAGLLLNGVVIAANGAMPVSLHAAALAGVSEDRLALDADPAHEAADRATRAPWLADIVPVAAPWRREVVSPGDVLVAAGLATWLWGATRPTGTRRFRLSRGGSPRTTPPAPGEFAGAPSPAALPEPGPRTSASRGA